MDAEIPRQHTRPPKGARRLKDAALMADICREHFHEGKGYKTIKDDGKVRDEPTAARLVADARELGLILFDIDETFALRGRARSGPSGKLIQSFKLNNALVVEVPDFDASAGKDSSDKQSRIELVMQADDYIHTVLANHAGLLLRAKLEAGDHCAVAGGRAVNQTVRMIRRKPPPLDDVMVTSMGGRLWSHKWWRSGPSSMRPLDPDDSAFILFLAFENQSGTMFDQVGHKVFAEKREHARAVMKEHCMFQPGGKWYESKQPNRAIVGVGVVDPNSGHRAVRNYGGPRLVKDLMNRHLKAVKHELKEAIAIVKDSQLYFGDIANRFFPTLPLPDEFQQRSVEYYDKVYGELIKQLSELNKRLVVVEWAHIRGIRSVTAIAGGTFKLHALWTILFAGLQGKNNKLINTLVTDSKTARSLISAVEAYRKLDPSARRWYENLVPTFFLDPQLKD